MPIQNMATSSSTTEHMENVPDYDVKCRHAMGVTRNHLRRCHLSRENVSEIDLILARAGMFDLIASKVKEMTVCPKHRDSLGRYWQAPRTCQYIKHTEKFKKLEEGIVINFKTSKEIYTLFGEIAQVGSRKYHIYYFLNT